VNLGGGIGVALAILALLTALAAVATFIALGTQRGRVERLENSNDDLRKEIEDEKRRHTTTRKDLEEASDRLVRQQSVIDHLKGEVETMSNVFKAVSGPIAALTAAMDSDHKLLAGHHREAMFGQELLAGMVLDLLHMNGDKRNRQTIAQAMRASERDAPDA
jgi:hypothetical protein